MHYADDAVIIIKQNRCFKEVIKDLSTYEDAAGARVNYGKTKGLWVGKWKYRQDKPLGIEWTSGNVKNIGIYFGNDNPGSQTFDDILPKIKKSMNYWKLSKFSKQESSKLFTPQGYGMLLISTQSQRNSLKSFRLLLPIM